jgi:hypothetical protein
VARSWLWTVKLLWRQASICLASGGRITSFENEEADYLAAQSLAHKLFPDRR